MQFMHWWCLVVSEIELLNAVASGTYEAREEQWKNLLRTLRLGLLYVPAVKAVLKEGAWKHQPNPMWYVRKGAVRCAVRMGIVDIRPNQEVEILACDLLYRDEDGEPLDHDDKLGMGVPKHENKFGPEYDHDRHAMEDRVADALVDEDLEVDWERVAELTEIDPGERLVMDLRMIGFGREAALAACSTEDERRILQAAWRRFDRHKGALSEALQSGEPHRARRVHRPPPAELELIFNGAGDGGLH